MDKRYFIDIPNEHLSYICRKLTVRKKNPFQDMEPFFSLVDGKSWIAGILFTLIVRESFTLSRYPGFEDRLLGFRLPDPGVQALPEDQAEQAYWLPRNPKTEELKKRHEALKIIRTWFDQEPQAPYIIRACAQDLLDLQRQQIDHYGAQTHLTLYRKIGWLEGESLTPYMLAIHHAVQVSRQNNQTHVDLDMDTVTHWSHVPYAYERGDNRISIRCVIPVTDVLLDSHLIAGDHPHTSGIEEEEVLVVNRSPKGLMPIPLDAITFEGPAFAQVTAEGRFPERLPARISEDMVEDGFITFSDTRPDFADYSLPGLLKAWWRWRTRRT